MQTFSLLLVIIWIISEPKVIALGSNFGYIYILLTIAFKYIWMTQVLSIRTMSILYSSAIASGLENLVPLSTF